MRILISKKRFVTWILLGVFWVLGTYAFIFQLISEELASSVRVPLYLLADILILVTGICVMRNRTDIWLCGSFIVISFTLTVFFNNGSLIQWINGLRDYIGLLFVIPIFRWLMSDTVSSNYFIPLMDKTLYIFLWIQAPCLLYQYFVYGGWDYGGGSLGFLFSGVISTLIYLISFYLLTRRWKGDKSFWRNLKSNYVLLLLLIPSFLNETKISFIFLLLYFVLIIPFSKQNIKKLLFILPVGIIFISLAAYIYSSSYGASSDKDVFSLEYLQWYTVGDEDALAVLEVAYDNMDDEEESDYQRGLKFLAFSWIVQSDPQILFTGKGLGQFKGGSVLTQTPFAKQYDWFLSGTTMTLLNLLIELGLPGLIWFIVFCICSFRPYIKLGKNRAKSVSSYLFMILLITILYNTSLNIQVFYLIFMYMLFLSSRWEKTRIADSVKECVRHKMFRDICR